MFGLSSTSMQSSYERMLFLKVAVVLLSHGVTGLVFEPQPTLARLHVPAAARAAEPTPFVRKPPHGALLARQDSDDSDAATCGYFNADQNDPYYCDSGYVCAYLTLSQGDFGPYCCGSDQTSGCGTLPTSCVSYSDNPGYYESTSQGLLYCGMDNIFCATKYLEGSSYGETSPVFTSYLCASSSYSEWAYQYITTSAGEETSSSYSPTFTATSNYSSTATPASSIPSSTTLSDASSTSNSPSLTLSSTASSDPASSSLPSSSPSPTPTKHSDAAAIGGGVGGGVGGALIIAGIVGWLVYRKRKAREEKLPEMVG